MLRERSGLIKGGWKHPRRRRDRLDIMAEMLETAKGGTLKTRIMYGANLSSAQLDEYLSLLIEIGLLRNLNDSGKTLYKTTTMGIRFIEDYRKISTLLEG